MPRTSSFALMLLAALIAALPVGHAVAMTADEYFTDGNRLYYNDLYWAALLRYQQAADEGLDAAVLHSAGQQVTFETKDGSLREVAALKLSRPDFEFLKKALESEKKFP